MRISKQTFFLFLILLISAFLRFYSLCWDNGSFFNPDERNMAGAVSQMKLVDGLNPHFFAYGGFPLYLAYFSYQAFGLLGYLISQFLNFSISQFLNFPNNLVPFGNAILWLRFWSALSSTLTVLLVYLITKELLQAREAVARGGMARSDVFARVAVRRPYPEVAEGDRRDSFAVGRLAESPPDLSATLISVADQSAARISGVDLNSLALLAALLTAFTPGLIQAAHFGTTESLLTFFFLATLYLSLKILKNQVVSYKKYLILNTYYLILISLTLGLALGTKLSSFFFFPAPLIVLSLPFVSLLKKRGKNFLTNAFRHCCIIIFVFSVIIFFFLISSPYHFLNFPEAYRISLYEAEVASGTAQIFYTRQFINTLPVLFQLEKIFPFALGWPIFILGSIGLLLLTIRLFMLIIRSMFSKISNFKLPAFGGFSGEKQISNQFQISNLKSKNNYWELAISILIISFLAYFLPNAFLFAKWTRFMTPIFPFFPIFAAYFLFLLSRFLRSNTFFLHCCIVAFSIVSFLPGLAFFSIYTHEDVRASASRFIYQNIPSGSHVLFDTGNVIDIPILLPNFQLPTPNFQLHGTSFDFYGLDNSSRLFEDLLEEITKADYIFVPSRRIFANHLRLSDKYPKTARYYELLFSGQLGFKKIQEISSYPSLPLISQFLNFPISFPDEVSEETFTVFDHPVIRIYKKTNYLSRDAYRELFL